MEVVEGQVLAGKYRIERVLGRGGMGLVVAATHLQLGERVALKFLLPEALDNPEAVTRFDREARAAVRIKSEHVARVSDFGTLDNGAPYLVMEYLEGIDLSLWLAHRGPLPAEQAVEFVLQACEAIAEAHTLGIVHRDLKPANLFVIEGPDGALSVKVLDFGISKTTGPSSGAGVTRTSTAIGSPLYMSPEQMQSAKDVDSRGDIWALGVVLYELLSARTPFPGDTMASLVLKVMTMAPTPLRPACPHVPAGLELVVLKCLEKDPAARYQTVAEFAAALFEFAPRKSKASVERIGRVMQRAGMSATLSSLPPSSNSVDANSAVAPTLASWGQTTPPPKRRRQVIFIGAGCVVLAVSVVGVRWVRSVGQGRNLDSNALSTSGNPSALQAAALHAAKAAPAVEPLVSAAAERQGVPPSDSPATSESSAARRQVNPAESSARATMRAPSGGSSVRKPATPSMTSPPPLPPATVVVQKPAASAKNPLKMSIQ